MDIEKLNEYIDKHLTPIDELLYRLQRETHIKTLAPQMSSGHTQGRLLSLISKMIRPQHILEIGTYTGYATLCLAQGLRPEGSIITIDTNEEVGYIARKYFDESPYGKQIIQVFQKAEDYLPTLNQTFDVIFIDANKEAYIDYYHLLIDKVRPGGFILADNILWYGKVWDQDGDRRTALLHQFNEMVASDPRVENVIIPLRDGINLIRKK